MKRANTLGFAVSADSRSSRTAERVELLDQGRLGRVGFDRTLVDEGAVAFGDGGHRQAYRQKARGNLD